VKDGVLTTPNGQQIKVSGDSIVDFLANAAIVQNKDGSITISSTVGSVTYANGKLTFVDKGGNSKEVGTDCLKVVRSGNSLTATCKNGVFTVGPDGLQVVGKDIKDLSTNQDVKGFIGSIKLPNCDATCIAKKFAALQTYLQGQGGCTGALGDVRIVISCTAQLNDQQKNTILMKSVDTVNEQTDGAMPVEAAAIEDVTKVAKASASSFAVAALAAIVAFVFVMV